MLKRELYLIYQKYITSWSRRTYSQFAEDIVLDHLFKRKNHGFYIDVGAHHPFHYSNTALLNKKRHWSGINIEPNPDLFKLFPKYRPSDCNLNIGISNHVGELTFHFMHDPLRSSFNKNEVEKNIALGNPVLRTAPIAVMPLQAVVEKYNTQKRPIDLLSVDVEGHDLTVLQSLDFQKNAPSVIVVEDHQFSLESPGEITAFLLSLGYEFVSKCAFSLVFRLK